MSLVSKITFILFAGFGLIFLAAGYLLLQGSQQQWVAIVRHTFDLPFFSFGVLFLAARTHDLLKKYKKNSPFFHFLLAIFATFLILALIYVNEVLL
jgi:hypothetical protein